METVKYSELRANLAATLDKVNDNHEPVIVTRKGSEKSAVIISLEDFASYEETRYLTANPANAARLQHSISQLENADTKSLSADELWQVVNAQASDHA